MQRYNLGIHTVYSCSTFINFFLANNLPSVDANFVYAWRNVSRGKQGNIMFP